MVAPIVGARTAQQLQASLDADGVRLPAAIRTALEDVSAPPFSPERRSEAMTAAAPALGGDPVFAAFCAAGLWPGLGKRTAADLPAAGITSPTTSPPTG